MTPASGTPVIPLARLARPGEARILVKLETFQPTGSALDRVALPLLDAARAAGELAPGAAVIAASLGDLAIALARACAMRGHPMRAVLPESVSPERRAILGAYGVPVELSSAELHLEGAWARARELASAHPGALTLGDEPSAVAHAYETTLGPELARDIEEAGGAGALVLGIGTGATLAGVGRVLKARAPGLRLVPVLPTEFPHHLQGLGPLGPTGRVLAGLELSPPERVHEWEAWEMRQRLAREEGLLLSLSSAANVAAALRVARRLGPGAPVYTLAWSSGERELSLGAYFP